MNGRIYDPLLGRFLSADITVQFPSDLQSYNRYSYVRNNPLSTTDPTGFEEKETPEQKAARVAAAKVASDAAASKAASDAATKKADAAQTTNQPSPQVLKDNSVKADKPDDTIDSNKPIPNAPEKPATPPTPAVGTRKGDWTVKSDEDSKRLLGTIKGSTIVADGKGGIKAFVNLGNAKLTDEQKKIFETGKVKHEMEGHAKDALASDPNIAKGYTTGPLATLGVHRTFDSLNRLGSVSVPSVLSVVNYQYDPASRLETISSGANSAQYTYVPNSPLVGTITFKDSGTTRLTTTKVYDNLNRLGSVTNTPSGSSVFSVVYNYNSANQRTQATRETNAYWQYSYDALGQVTSGQKHFADGTAVNGLDYSWSYDDIGNRKTAATNSQITNYAANALNQYSSRTVPGILDVFGEAASTSTVTVALNNGTPQPTTRQGDFFYKQLTVDNSSAAQNPSVKITGVQNLVGPGGEDAVTTVTKTPFLPKTPEVFAHDADGNLTSDARWSYTWDAENRLVAMETKVGTVVPNGPLPASARQRLEFAYDGQGRRISKKVYNWTGSTWTLGTSTRSMTVGT